MNLPIGEIAVCRFTIHGNYPPRLGLLPPPLLPPLLPPDEPPDDEGEYDLTGAEEGVDGV
jgi:hypothetical protein